jgi:hypothetical protein
MQNEVDLLIQAVEKEVALNPKSIGGELLPEPVGAETVVTDAQSRPTFKIKEGADFAKYRSYHREAERIPIWAGFLFARHARAMATKHYEQKLGHAIDSYFRENLRALEDFVDEQRALLKNDIEDRYRREALKRLANPQNTGILNKLHSRIGSRREITNRDGITVKVTGLRQTLDDFTRCLTELGKEFRKRSETYDCVPSSARNLNIPLNMNYPEEIEAYLVPQLNVSSRGEVLTQSSNEYFVRSGLIGGNGAHCGEAGEVETLIEGIREIYYRATRRNSSPMEWEQVRQGVQAFALDEMRNLKGNDMALVHFCEGLNDDAERIQRALIRQVEMGAVRIQRPELSPMEFISVQSLSILGISDTSHPLCEQVRTLTYIRENPYRRASALTHANDSILFFTEQVAFPVFYVGGLRDLRESYIVNIRRNPNHVYWRHFKRGYEKYGDILPPGSPEEALRIAECTKLVVEALIWGNIGYAETEGGFYFTSAKRGIERQNYLAATIQGSANVLQVDQDIHKQLMQRNQLVFDRWSHGREVSWHFQFLRIYKYLIETVYPDNFQTAILGESIHLKSMNHTVVSMLYEQYWNTIKGITGWTDEQICEELSNYDNLDTFSVVLDYQEPQMQGPFRVLCNIGPCEGG